MQTTLASLALSSLSTPDIPGPKPLHNTIDLPLHLRARFHPLRRAPPQPVASPAPWSPKRSKARQVATQGVLTAAAVKFSDVSARSTLISISIPHSFVIDPAFRPPLFVCQLITLGTTRHHDIHLTHPPLHSTFALRRSRIFPTSIRLQCAHSLSSDLILTFPLVPLPTDSLDSLKLSHLSTRHAPRLHGRSR